MCAGYELDTNIEDIERAFRVPLVQLDLPLGLSQVFPKGRAPIVIEGARDGELVRRAGLAQFGFVPSFARDPRDGARHFNARAETAQNKPMFRAAFARRRCLVPSTGFYEWSHAGPKPVRRTFRAARGGLFALAGLWEVWHPPEGERLVSFAILTTEPSSLVAPIHDRMPAVLAPEDYDRWLSPGTPASELAHLLRPHGEDLIALEPVPLPDRG
jgi:putative SOS response-associated peptidase YedK